MDRTGRLVVFLYKPGVVFRIHVSLGTRASADGRATCARSEQDCEVESSMDNVPAACTVPGTECGGH